MAVQNRGPLSRYFPGRIQRDSTEDRLRVQMQIRLPYYLTVWKVHWQASPIQERLPFGSKIPPEVRVRRARIDLPFIATRPRSEPNLCFRVVPIAGLTNRPRRRFSSLRLKANGQVWSRPSRRLSKLLPATRTRSIPNRSLQSRMRLYTRFISSMS